MNVLCTSAGRRVALVRAFQAEIAAIGGGELIAADLAPALSAAAQVADRTVSLPRCTEAEYVAALEDCIRRYRVDVVVPLLDTELPVLAASRDRLEQAGCCVLVSDRHAIEITRDKRRTAECFARLGFLVPAVVPPELLQEPSRLSYPLFVKPAAGSSSIGAVAVGSADELRFHLARTADPVVQAFEAGDEYTLDVFADLSGAVRCVVPRRRLEVRAGEISKGVTVRERRLIDAARALVEALGGCRGCVTLQCFLRASGEVVFFEANLRFGGGFPLSYAAGANYVRWILDMCAGRPVADFDGWVAGMTMLRYDDAVFYRS